MELKKRTGETLLRVREVAQTIEKKLNRKLKISNKGFTQFVLDREMMERGEISFGAVVWYGIILMFFLCLVNVKNCTPKRRDTKNTLVSSRILPYLRRTIFPTQEMFEASKCLKSFSLP